MPAVLVMFVAFALTLAGAVRHSTLYAHNVRDINRMQVAMAKSLLLKLPPGSLVAANDIGALAYFTDFRVLDLFGIISTQTLDALEKAGVDPDDRSSARDAAFIALITRERPDALVVFPGWFESVLGHFRPGLQVIEMKDYPDDVTSGDSRLAAIRIDWTRLPPP
jgi:hypothetical protein